MTRYVGLDAHSKRSVYVIQDEQGKVVAEGSVPTTLEGLLGLRNRYELPTGTRVALESGTMAFFVARHLTQMGLDPLVVDAGEVRAKALRPNQKSDRRDALELCEGLRRGIYRTAVHVPPLAIERLRETLARRRHFVRAKTREVNAVKHLLACRRTAGTVSQSAARTRAGASSWSPSRASPHSMPSVPRTAALWRCAADQVVALEAQLHAQQAPFEPEMDRLQTIPGVGPIVALTVIAVFSDVRRFPTAKHAASYAGLVASTYDSGERVQHGHITRRGSSELRSMLCEAAHHAGRAEQSLPSVLRQSLRASGLQDGGDRRGAPALPDRLGDAAIAGHDFDLARLDVEEGRFEQTIVRRYRRRSPAQTA